MLILSPKFSLYQLEVSRYSELRTIFTLTLDCLSILFLEYEYEALWVVVSQFLLFVSTGIPYTYTYNVIDININIENGEKNEWSLNLAYVMAQFVMRLFFLFEFVKVSVILYYTYKAIEERV